MAQRGKFKATTRPLRVVSTQSQTDLELSIGVKKAEYALKQGDWRAVDETLAAVPCPPVAPGRPVRETYWWLRAMIAERQRPPQ